MLLISSGPFVAYINLLSRAGQAKQVFRLT
jgi:hypothetical protein